MTELLDLDSILIEQGLGRIPFGASVAHIRTMLGSGCRRILDDDGDLDLIYDSLKIEFRFWAEFEGGLGSIVTERPQATLLGERLAGQPIDVVRKFVSDRLVATVSEEDGCLHDDGVEQSWLEVGERNVCFWFHDEVLYMIEWMGGWIDDTPQWAMSRTNGRSIRTSHPSRS
jgi:hypothetical protein